MRSRILIVLSSLALLVAIPPVATACSLVSGCGEDPDCTYKYHGTVDPQTCQCSSGPPYGGYVPVGTDTPPAPPPPPAAPPGPRRCATDADCPATTCVDQVCTDRCASDAACRKDARCDLATGACSIMCGADGGCDAGATTDGRSCVTNAECNGELGALCSGGDHSVCGVPPF